MMDITLKINGKDYSQKLSTYTVSKEASFQKTIVTLDNTERSFGGSARTVITFSLFPLTDAQAADLYDGLSKMIFSVEFTDPYLPGISVSQMRLASNIESVFALKSIDGNRYYKGGQIQLRAVSV